MASLFVYSLFTNIPLDETIDICVSRLHVVTDMVNGIRRDDFRTLLTQAIKESLVIFKCDYYKQIDSVAIGPSCPGLANSFLCHHERVWLKDCPPA